MLMNIPEIFVSKVIPPQQGTVPFPPTPIFPGDPLRTAVRSNPDCYGASALSWDPVHNESLCVPLKYAVSISPSPGDLLSTSPTGFQCQMLWGLFLPMLDPQAWGPDVGLRTLTPIGEFL